MSLIGRASALDDFLKRRPFIIDGPGLRAEKQRDGRVQLHARATRVKVARGLFYSPVIIHHEKVPNTQTDFPVLVSFVDNRFKSISFGGHVQSPSGFDIRPYADAALSIPLSFTLHRYNPSTGELIMWVKLPSVSSLIDTIFYLLYDDVALTTDGSSPSTWSNGFMGVYDLKDGTILSVADSLGVRNGTNHGATATTGQIDGAANFVAASSQYIDAPTINSPAAATLSGWAYVESLPSVVHDMMGIHGLSGFVNFLVGVIDTGALRASGGGATTVSYFGGGANILSTHTWYYLALEYSNPGGLNVYVNAALDNHVAGTGDLNCGSQPTNIGTGGVGFYWDGKICCVRAANVARSTIPGWYRTEFNNQGDPATFETLGAEIAL